MLASGPGKTCLGKTGAEARYRGALSRSPADTEIAEKMKTKDRGFANNPHPGWQVRRKPVVDTRVGSEARRKTKYGQKTLKKGN